MIGGGKKTFKHLVKSLLRGSRKGWMETVRFVSVDEQDYCTTGPGRSGLIKLTLPDLLS